MSVFAIADTHLSLSVNKPMDSFDGWNDYVKRLEKNWNSVVEKDDTVVVAGDISWAMNFEELKKDFEFLNSLNGTKILIKGNHDYWWNTKTKIDKFISENNFDSLKILFNNSYDVEDVSICGSRGWMMETETEHDEKVLNREVGRLELSLKDAKSTEKIVFLHYPPVTVDSECEEITKVLRENGIKNCYYGHLHGMAAKYGYEGEKNGIKYKLISADRLSFTPLLVKKLLKSCN